MNKKIESKPPATTNPPLFSLQAFQQAFKTPWKARNEIERLLIMPFAALRWRSAGVKIGSGWKCYGFPLIQRHRDSLLQIGHSANLRSHLRSNPLGPNHAVLLSTRTPQARLRIGDHFGMTGGSIICEESIQIGHRVLVGANVLIMDTDFHPLDPLHRFQFPLDCKTAPVIIGDDVFIGTGAIILKGVTIGHSAVIGAGSVVSRDVAPLSVVAGNPAKLIKSLDSSVGSASC
ncbi:hypothetical protein MASR2M15_11220 [Anaerolineales bacterium]